MTEPTREQQEMLRKLFAQQATIAPKEHAFWDKQPVPKGDEVRTHGPLDVHKTVDDVRETPLRLPEAYTWCSCDISDAVVLDEVYDLLTAHYVEDDDNMFRFDYSRDFLRWALTPPGNHADWIVGIRVKATGKLVAMITGIPVEVKAYDAAMHVAEINFLCIHRKLRSKRLAPVLIKEVTRRVNRRDVWQAVYTAGVVLPTPVASTRYFHRSLNPKKLIEVGFSHLAPNLTMASTIKLYRVPTATQIPHIRPMEQRDVAQVCDLLNTYLGKFKLRMLFSKEEVQHWLLPRAGVMYSYVVSDPATNHVTDMVSFYELPSTIIGNPKHATFKAAYSYYHVATSVPLQDLLQDALILAKQHDFDVYNALNLMENETFVKDLKFGIGDGKLQYYLYNWGCPTMQNNDVGLVLL